METAIAGQVVRGANSRREGKVNQILIFDCFWFSPYNWIGVGMTRVNEREGQLKKRLLLALKSRSCNQLLCLGLAPVAASMLQLRRSEGRGPARDSLL